MENLAYLHHACAYEASASSEPIPSRTCAPYQGGGLNWTRLSSWAWRYLLPLALNLAILSIATHALALQRGDRGPEVKALQEKLKVAGFFPAISTTELYGSITEDAVRQFQTANKLNPDGVAGAETINRLQSYRRPQQNPPQSNQSNRNSLRRGDSGEPVRVLQEQLAAAGFFKANPTGVFGPVTEDAVRRFQAKHNLIADGVVRPTTQRKLDEFGSGIGGEAPPSQVSNRDILRRGDTGKDVRVLQEQLKKAGFFNGSPTGNFGPVTEAAVRQFQSVSYLKASGIAGPTTRSKLQQKIDPSSTDTTASVPSQFGVSELQRQLQKQGFYEGPIDGRFGPATKIAVLEAQRFYGVSETDIRNGRF